MQKNSLFTAFTSHKINPNPFQRPCIDWLSLLLQPFEYPKMND